MWAYYGRSEQNSRRAQGIGIGFTQLSCTGRRTSLAAHLFRAALSLDRSHNEFMERRADKGGRTRNTLKGVESEHYNDNPTCSTRTNR